MNVHIQCWFRSTQETEIRNLFTKKTTQLKAKSPLSLNTKKHLAHAKGHIGRYIKLGIVALLVLVFGVSQLSNYVSSESRYVAPQARLQNPLEVGGPPPVDAVISAEVAAIVAQEADLAIAPAAITKADTLKLQVSMSTPVVTSESENSAVVDKPQLVAPSVKSAKDIKTVTIKEGDTVASLAATYGINENTIRWANNLSASATLKPGATAIILPVSGILHTVLGTDTTDGIASRYQASSEQVIAINDLELGGLKAGSRIIVPNGVKPVEVSSSRGGFSGASSSTFGSGRASVFAGNRYAYGYCTYYVYDKRAASGRPIGSFWGNATTWASAARSAGFAVDKNPRVGDVLQSSGGWGGYGHVAYVEAVNADGSVSVSEMNYAGWNVISRRTIPASQVGTYNFIH